MMLQACFQTQGFGRVAQRCLAQRCTSEAQSKTVEPQKVGQSVQQSDTSTVAQSTQQQPDQIKKLGKAASKIANVYAPRQSGPKKKNPAVPGSFLYSLFEWQAWIATFAGGLLALNIIFPSEKASAQQFLGAWIVFMITIPSLRAREVEPKEKKILDYAFLLVPVVNILLPFIYKSLGLLWFVDSVGLIAAYYITGVYRLPGQEPQAPEKAKDQDQAQP